jgi:exodeoxyribonuclease V alpha subunit
VVNQPPSTFPESLSGFIERVTFFNEENGFGVLRVKARGHRDLVTVVGSLPSVSPIDPVEREVAVRFDQREVVYDYGELDEVSLAYAITIHKSQGSEFPAIVIPLVTQQYLLLQRNLVYTGITRGKNLVVVIGQRKAMAMAIRNNRTEQRFSGLLARLKAS